MTYRRSRTLMIVLSIVIILIIVVGIGGLVIVRRSFPQTDGSFQIPFLKDRVEVFRDEFGVPHIYASNEYDLFVAQGFVHAQDRFWQMEFWRRIGAGRLSEILGPSALEQDRFIRTVGWNRTAQQEVELLSGPELAVLQAYADGVNYYIDTQRGKLSLEFTLLGLTGVSFDPEPWMPLNSLSWAKVMAWDLGGNRSDELTRANILAVLGSEALEELMPPYPADYPVIVSHALNEATLGSVPEAAFDMRAFGSGEGLGSNNWVISGARTESGKPILANDPHLGIQMPSIWYETGLHCEPVGPQCPYNIVGATFAGVPGVIIGHNDSIAWGVTNLGPDVQDLFVENLNPENPNQVEFRGRWEEMQVIEEQIFVAGQEEPEILRVRVTRHGPIINDVLNGIEEDWSYGWQPLALSWTALEPGTIVQSVLTLNRASNWEEFREALRYWDAPSQNFVYADVEGNIGYQAPGRIPIRAAGNGTLPAPGWSGTHEWIGYLAFDDLPNAFNPEIGYIATANNAVVDSSYPYFLSADWSPGFRARRIVELIEATGKLTIDDMRRIQGDSSPIYAQDILPYVLAVSPSESRQAQALDMLRTWDGIADRDSAAAALFESLRGHLVIRVFKDDVGEALLRRAGGELQVALLNLFEKPESHWFDDIDTLEVESMEQIVLLALQDAIDELDEKLGGDMASWRWGDLHTATFENQSLGQSGIGLIEAIFNRGPVPVDGAIATVNNTGYSLNEPYSVTTVPSIRHIIDFEYFEQSLAMHTTGQSGHAYNRHYDDMIDPWRNIEYHPMLWTRGQVEAAAESHLTLVP
jgi:penicillin amidase